MAMRGLVAGGQRQLEGRQRLSLGLLQKRYHLGKRLCHPLSQHFVQRCYGLHQALPNPGPSEPPHG